MTGFGDRPELCIATVTAGSGFFPFLLAGSFPNSFIGAESMRSQLGSTAFVLLFASCAVLPVDGCLLAAFAYRLVIRLRISGIHHPVMSQFLFRCFFHISAAFAGSGLCPVGFTGGCLRGFPPTVTVIHENAGGLYSHITTKTAFFPDIRDLLTFVSGSPVRQ